MNNTININSLIEKIYDYSRDNIVFVVLRHSIRERITDLQSIRDAPLTHEGRDLAYKFGKLLPVDKFIRLFHSPVPRCKDTAELIYRGFKYVGGSGSIIGEQNFLAGPYLLKPELALNMLNTLGGLKFIEEWYKGRVDKAIIDSPLKARNDFINSLIKCNRNNLEEIDIHISHDLNLVLFKDLLFNALSKNFKWPKYMEGAIFKRENKQVVIFMENKEKIIKI